MKNEEKYTRFALVREMMETPGIIRNFKLDNADDAITAIKEKGKLFYGGRLKQDFPCQKCYLFSNEGWFGFEYGN